MSNSIEQRVKQKLKDLSRKSKIPFNSLLDNIFLERFLARISGSAHKDNLIFKGGMCLAHYVSLDRATKDIDFLFTENKVNLLEIETIFQDISNIDLNDGLSFSKIDVSELSIEHKKYPGYRITLQGMLGQIVNKVSIDVGVGDVVKPIKIDYKLLQSNGPVFEEDISLIAYPPEYIFSEKYEAIIQLGEINSRMKDFYDCFSMMKNNVIDVNDLRAALDNTLNNRGTTMKHIPKPTGSLTQKWKSFTKKNKVEDLELDTVVSKINKFLSKLS